MDTELQEDLPAFEIVGTLDELTLEGGHNNDDGWGYSRAAIGVG
jgi:hypothetical protein